METSTPSTTFIPNFSPALIASSKPSIVSLSVTPKAFNPRSFAFSTSSLGENSPSEVVLWLWRSAMMVRFIGMKLLPCNRFQLVCSKNNSNFRLLKIKFSQGFDCEKRFVETGCLRYSLDNVRK